MIIDHRNSNIVCHVGPRGLVSKYHVDRAFAGAYSRSNISLASGQHYGFTQLPLVVAARAAQISRQTVELADIHNTIAPGRDVGAVNQAGMARNMLPKMVWAAMLVSIDILFLILAPVLIEFIVEA